MDTTLSFQEDFHALWRYGTWIAAGLSLLFALIFWSLTNPLWVGIFRLVAFVFFSFAVFGLLKRLSGPLQLVISRTPEDIIIEYRKKEKVVHVEKIERATIGDITISEDSSFLSRLPATEQSTTLFIHFQDEEQSLPLFEYDGRTLFFNRSSMLEADRYLQNSMSQESQI